MDFQTQEANMKSSTDRNKHAILKNLEKAFEYSPMCMLLAKSPEGDIFYANKAAQTFLEQGMDELIKINNSNYHEKWSVQKHSGEQLTPSQFPLPHSMQSGEVVSNEMLHIKLRNNRHKWSLANSSPIYDEHQKIIANMLLWADITEQKTIEKDLLRKADFDHLTGIYSRQKIVALAERKLQRKAIDNETQCFVLIDLDKFKNINDAYGHPIGDDVLVKFVRLISDNIRPDDLFGRYGGEEFLIVTQHSASAGCFEFAEKLRALIENTPIETEIGNINLTISASIVSVDCAKKEPFKTLIKRLDKALYTAKRDGRNRVHRALP